MPNNTPTPDELRALLGEFPGAATAAAARLTLLLNQARQAFESDTNLKPLLVAENAAATVRRVRARNGFVNFPGPLIHLDAVRVEGQPVEELGWGFGLMPESEPISTYLVFDERISTPPGGVEIEGVWGAFTTLPDDVKTAILCHAAVLFVVAANLSPTLGGLITAPGAIKKRQDEDVSEERVTGTEGGAGAVLGAQRAATSEWRDLYRATVESYQVL